METYDLESAKQNADRIEELELQVQHLEARLRRFESGSSKSLCNIHAPAKERFLGTMGSLFPEFNSSGELVWYCLEKVTGLNREEWCGK